MGKSGNNNQLFENGDPKKPDRRSPSKIPLYVERISAGFPSPADDFLEKQLDLNDYIGGHKPSVFLVRVRGDSMQGAGIFDGDLLVVDRAEEATHNSVVLGVLDGEFTVKRLVIKNKQLFLMPDNPNFSPILVTGEMDFQVWGVVTFSIHNHK